MTCHVLTHTHAHIHTYLDILSIVNIPNYFIFIYIFLELLERLLYSQEGVKGDEYDSDEEEWDPADAHDDGEDGAHSTALQYTYGAVVGHTITTALTGKCRI